ncbi:type 1 glutamine amidotransferase domain-containing protein [Citreimonas salinaria]|uniref:Protease I n=1 Tax=Citreimonas salinaria TaxID=321339 RepID=A0A1H3HUQ5_9RHOB|nr:type 1 glutamine amidotransferase domain-containing protein [Citreimonas salinaria]SDY19142.1 protease I [Citreimonas salinaria]
MTAIANARILIMATNGFEQSELEVPRDTLRDHGATVEIASTDGKAIKGWDKTDWGREAEVDLKIEDVDPNRYDALVLPGGQINPDILRTHAPAVAAIKAFAKQDKIIAAICHAPWLLIEAELVAGRELTSYHSIKNDVVNAGGRWMDEEVVADHALITSRNPGDLEAFCNKIVEEIESGHHARKAA